MNADRARRTMGNVLPPVVLGVVFVALWQLWVEYKDVQPFVIPKPTAIVDEFFDKFDLVLDACKVTGLNALIGLVLGTVIGFGVAALTNRFKLVSEIVDPLAVTIAAIPAVVIVGVLNRMYPLDSQTGRRIMVTLAVFFIVFVQVAKGLRQNDATQMELMRSYAATPRQTLAKVRLPNTMPYLFTGIRTAVPIAVIIALVSEYFGGTQDGLGSKISGTLNSSNKALGFAYVMGGSILGLLFFVGANLLEHAVVPW
ncbi:MAG: putative ABC transporter permease protein, partial [Acidimicrobiaceae bacterium]